jgi:hypothetical protein
MVLRTKMSPADACALSTRNNMADKAPSKFTVHGRLAQFQNDIKAQNAEIAKLRNEMADVRIMLTAMLECNTKAGEYLNFLRERTAKILAKSAAERRS